MPSTYIYGENVCPVFSFSSGLLTASAQQTDIAAVRNGQVVEVAGERFRVSSIENPDIIGETFSTRFRYEKWDNSRIRELSDQYHPLEGQGL